MTTLRNYYCPECGRPMPGIPGQTAKCSSCGHAVTLPFGAPAPTRPGRGTGALAGLFVLGLCGVIFLWSFRETSAPISVRTASIAAAVPDAPQLDTQQRLEVIWEGIQEYRTRHGAWPSNLADLVREGNLDAYVLADPQAGDTPAPGPTLQDQVMQLARTGHNSFEYISPYSSNGQRILVYERPPSGRSSGAWVLNVDGSILQSVINFGR